MPLGYILKAEDVMAYYSRKEVALAIFNYARHRHVRMSFNPGPLGRGGGEVLESPEKVEELVKAVLRNQKGKVPKSYPSFHATIRKWKEGRVYLDMVFDIDIKNDYKEAFRQGRRIMDFLYSYGLPFFVKFSGGSGPHIIIPCEAFGSSLSREEFQQVFHFIASKSGARGIDGSFTSPAHYMRLPYSLNEHTGLASVPISLDDYDRFELEMAEVGNFEVKDIPNIYEGPREGMDRLLHNALYIKRNVK